MCNSQILLDKIVGMLDGVLLAFITILFYLFFQTTFQPCGAKLEDIAFHFGIQIGKLSSPFYVLDSDHPTEEYGKKLL